MTQLIRCFLFIYLFFLTFSNLRNEMYAIALQVNRGIKDGKETKAY